MGRNLDDVSRALVAEKPEGRRHFLGRTLAVFGIGAAAAVGLEPGVAEAKKKAKCPSGSLLCDGTCRDVAINPDHCGACGHACPPGTNCRGGVCVDCICGAVCPSGQAFCNGGCIDVQSNPSHCGNCGTVCASGQVCTNGACHAGPQTCQSAADCGQATACRSFTCVQNTCQTIDTAAGTLAGIQTSGDCQKSVSDGSGGIHLVPDNVDVPNDGNECTLDICTNGVPSHPSAGFGTPCTGGICDGSGACSPTLSICGDNIVSGAELCDGVDLNGQSCASLGFSSGTLACGPGCTFDTSGCVV